MPLSSQILLSTSSSFGTGFNPATARKLVENKQATVITPGASGFDVVQSVSPTVDTLLTSASSGSPLLLGVDNILFIPLQIPEPAAL